MKIRAGLTGRINGSEQCISEAQAIGATLEAKGFDRAFSCSNFRVDSFNLSVDDQEVSSLPDLHDGIEPM
jgi:hypothetical protein